MNSIYKKTEVAEWCSFLVSCSVHIHQDVLAICLVFPCIRFIYETLHANIELHSRLESHAHGNGNVVILT